MTKKILIVDDEAHIAQLIEQSLEELEDEGVELLVANDGQRALELIESQRPQLVFLDVMMPKMNGFDVCKVVKKDLQLGDVFIVMLTAKGQEVDRQRGEEVGADRYITKPFDPDLLYDSAREVLGLE